ncbi:transposase family protein [Streptomyces sp. NPDC004284]|uniref:transposase family protein n=1 Tax=Streptomyces sp. NPDC004284 TaxID=3364695 RepID=UPI0036CBE081
MAASASCGYSRRAVVALVHPREYTAYEELAVGFRISEGTAHSYVQSVIKLLASRAGS